MGSGHEDDILEIYEVCLICIIVIEYICIIVIEYHNNLLSVISLYCQKIALSITLARNFGWAQFLSSYQVLKNTKRVAASALRTRWLNTKFCNPRIACTWHLIHEIYLVCDCGFWYHQDCLIYIAILFSYRPIPWSLTVIIFLMYLSIFNVYQSLENYHWRIANAADAECYGN